NGGANSQQFHNQSLARAPLWIAAAFGGRPAPVETFLGYALVVMGLPAFLAGVGCVGRPRRPGSRPGVARPGLARQGLARPVVAGQVVAGQVVAGQVVAGQVVATLPDELGMAELLGYSWALCTMVLVMPITWEHHDAWLLPAIVVCLGYAVRGPLVERRRTKLL